MLGSYKLNENDATDYFRLYETIRGEESLTESEQEVWLFAIYYDFLNYIVWSIIKFCENLSEECHASLVR